ncbi:MAG: PHP domain-containing protein [Pseudomonadota bacterium]
MAFANLHTHTLFSDGRITPQDLAKAVFEEKGLEIFALTDHDSLSGIEPLFRFKKAWESRFPGRMKRFVPGIEMTLMEEKSGMTIHMLGLFPGVHDVNLKRELKRIDAVLGEYCMFRCLSRGERDLDARIRYAYEINLDGLAEKYDSAESVIRILRHKAEAENREIFMKLDKKGDVIQHPIPLTYQAMIDHWEELVLASSKEKVTLYILRPDRRKQDRLARIYVEEGMGEKEAKALAEKNQGMLYNFKRPPPKDRSIFGGLELLRQAGAVTFLAHPAVDHKKIGYDEVDHLVLFPLVEKGLDGIEVIYPYDTAYRDEAIDHYGRIARDRGLLVTGGTDFHGDGRAGLDDVELGLREAERIINHGFRA